MLILQSIQSETEGPLQCQWMAEYCGHCDLYQCHITNSRLPVLQQTCDDVINKMCDIY